MPYSKLLYDVLNLQTGSLKAQEEFRETEVAEDALYKDLVAVFTPQVIALRLHTAGKK